ncbi:hypothetical protein P1J78_16145 [Psychromarinibacter sp. C21-152]|uniref:Uncharacterized protein n=1 Tax=Psychromarinibacter sediminicola TaxID=3033385 RepID=A0AAE3T9J4_9RHOB|nr:hypothetical protein [Psychromarinibacter sediminicola]MDF0602272.1 hypothetical protein [Psychromarinibacter sediminicola]
MVVFVLLAVGTFAYLWWKWHRTTLTRDCRWRLDKAAGEWRCAFCGARTRTESGRTPRHCARRLP